MTGEKPVNLRVASGLGLMKCGFKEKTRWTDTNFETSHLENASGGSREVVPKK